MLDIAFAELMGRTAQQVLAHEAGLGMDKGHHVLQLIAETECAAGLVVSAASPQTAGQRLIQKPAVRQYIERLIRCFNLYSAQRVLPVMPYFFQRVVRRRRAAVALHQMACIVERAPGAEPENNLTLFSVIQLDCKLYGRAGIQGGAYLVGKLRPGHRRRIAERAVASDELGAVAAEGPGGIVDVEERNAPGEFYVVGVACMERAAEWIDFSNDVHGRFRPQVAQHPLHVAGCGEPARAA